MTEETLAATSEQNAGRSGIPVIDVQASNAAVELVKAACDQGFIFVKHKDFELTPQDVDRMFNLVRITSGFKESCA